MMRTKLAFVGFVAAGNAMWHQVLDNLCLVVTDQSATTCDSSYAPNSTQYNSVLQSSEKSYPRTFLYYKVLFQKVLLQYYKVLIQYYSVLQSTTPVLLPTTILVQYYKVLLQYYKVLLQNYSVLQSTTPVLLRTKKKYSSTTSYYKVLVQYYFVLQNTTPILQSTTPVLLRTTKDYSSTTKYDSSTTSYYKVLLQYYKILLQYYFILQSTTPVLLVQYYFVLQSTSPELLRITKSYSSTTKWVACLIIITYETSFTMRGATAVTIQPPQILRLSRRKTHLLNHHYIWKLIYNARSNRCHDPASPNTAPVTQKDSLT